MRKEYLITAISLLLHLNVASAEICESILQSANYNQIQTISQTEQYSLQKANFCLAEYDKAASEQKVQIEVSYKLFSGDASGSGSEIKERQKKECDNKYGQYWFNQLGLLNQKIVSDKAMDTVAQCIIAKNQNLIVNPTFSESESNLSVTLTWKSKGELKFRGIRISSVGTTCKLEGKDTETPDLFHNRTIESGTSVTFTCDRTYGSETISGESVQCLPDGLITIDTEITPVTLSLFRRCKTDYLISRAKAVELKMSETNNTVNTIANQVSQLNLLTNRKPVLECKDFTQTQFTINGGADSIAVAKPGDGYSLTSGSCDWSSVPNAIPPLLVSAGLNSGGWRCHYKRNHNNYGYHAIATAIGCKILF